MRRARLAVALICALFVLVTGCAAEEGAAGGDQVPIDEQVRGDYLGNPGKELAR